MLQKFRYLKNIVQFTYFDTLISTQGQLFRESDLDFFLFSILHFKHMLVTNADTLRDHSGLAAQLLYRKNGQLNGRINSQ